MPKPINEIAQDLEANNLELWVWPQFPDSWNAAAICKESGVCKMVVCARSINIAIQNLAFKLKTGGLE